MSKPCCLEELSIESPLECEAWSSRSHNRLLQSAGCWTAFWLDEGFRVSGTSVKPTEPYSLDKKKTQWKLNCLLMAKFSFPKISFSTFHNNSSEKAPFQVLCAQWFYYSTDRERERQTHTQTHNQQWGRKTRKVSQWEIPNTDLLSKLRKYMYIIFECTQQLIFMCRVPRFVLFVIITHVGVFFLFFFPPSDSRKFLFHSISTPNPTSPPKNYNRIQQFCVFVPFVKDKMEQE
jgi:hypothetical protein